MSEAVCKLCNKHAEFTGNEGFIKCKVCGEIHITFNADNYIRNEYTYDDFRACAYHYITQYKFKKEFFSICININIELTERFPKVKQITVDEIMKVFPRNLTDRLNKTLINLSFLEDGYGSGIVIEWCNKKDLQLLSFSKTEKEKDYIFDILIKKMYLKTFQVRDQCIDLNLLANGWIKVDELKKNNSVYNKGFIAMWFDPKTDKIKNAIIEAFDETGYIVDIINNKEYSGQIVPEILQSIMTSDFVVADLTGNRGGVYYEAGYALALGKELIITVDQREIDKDMNKLDKDKVHQPHFDVAQRNQIRYKDEEDLTKRLVNRIKATVGSLKSTNY